MNKGLFTGLITAVLPLSFAFTQPAIVENPRDKTALYGATVAFSVAAQGSDTLKYQWSFNGRDILGAKSRTLRLIATPTRAGEYAVRVTDGYGIQSSAPARLEVVRRPVILVQPRNKVVGVHQTATFSTKLNASGPYTRMIWHNYNPSEGSHEIPDTLGFDVNSPVLEIPNCLQNDSYNGLYWLAVTNGAAGTVSRRAKLTVVGPPVLTDEPQDAELRSGQTITLRVRVAPDAAPWKTYQWYRENTPISGATRSYLILRHMTPDQTGNYYCIVTSIGGSTPSWGSQINVQ